MFWDDKCSQLKAADTIGNLLKMFWMETESVNRIWCYQNVERIMHTMLLLIIH